MESDAEKILRLTEEFIVEMEYRIPSSSGQWYTERARERSMLIGLSFSFFRPGQSLRLGYSFYRSKNAIIEINATFERVIRVLPTHTHRNLHFDQTDFGEEIVDLLVRVLEETQHPLFEKIRPNALASLILGFEEGTTK